MDEKLRDEKKKEDARLESDDGKVQEKPRSKRPRMYSWLQDKRMSGRRNRC